MKPIWQEEYIRSISNSILLSRRKGDTFLRQAFILLDNALEQFMKDSVNNKRNKKDEYFKFHVLLDEFKKEYSIPDNLIKRIKEFHDMRNILYHKSTYLSVTQNRIDDYLNINVMICNELQLFNLIELVNKEVKETENMIYNEILSRLNDNKSRVRDEIISLIIDNFRLVGTDFIGDFILGSPIGYTYGAYYNMMFIANNYINSADGTIKFLELIESHEENSFHSYLLSFSEIKTWYCYIDSIWSKNGDGNDPYCTKIKKFVDENRERIDYKKDYIRKGTLEKYFRGSLMMSDK